MAMDPEYREYLKKEARRLAEQAMTPEERRERTFRKRAERLGLPTDPAAYQDGGVVPAATAGNVGEAEFIAAVLRDENIPAWVEGAATSTWYWHMQYAMHPGGIRILVPASRLAEAQAIIQSHASEAAKPPAAESPEGEPDDTDEQETDDPGQPFYRSARRYAYLLFIGPLYPIILVLACRLLFKIGRQRLLAGLTPQLKKARRIALITVIYISLFAAVLGMILVDELSHESSYNPRLQGRSILIEEPGEEPGYTHALPDDSSPSESPQPRPRTVTSP